MFSKCLWKPLVWLRWRKESRSKKGKRNMKSQGFKLNRNVYGSFLLALTSSQWRFLPFSVPLSYKPCLSSEMNMCRNRTVNTENRWIRGKYQSQHLFTLFMVPAFSPMLRFLSHLFLPLLFLFIVRSDSSLLASTHILTIPSSNFPW